MAPWREIGCLGLSAAAVYLLGRRMVSRDAKPDSTSSGEEIPWYLDIEDDIIGPVDEFLKTADRLTASIGKCATRVGERARLYLCDTMGITAVKCSAKITCTTTVRPTQPTSHKCTAEITLLLVLGANEESSNRYMHERNSRCKPELSFRLCWVLSQWTEKNKMEESTIQQKGRERKEMERRNRAKRNEIEQNEVQHISNSFAWIVYDETEQNPVPLSGERMERELPAPAQRRSQHDEGPTGNSYRACIICLEDDYHAVFVPCGHMCCCTSCSSRLTKCPLCRDRIDRVVRTFRA